jgi:prophage regulatory protein
MAINVEEAGMRLLSFVELKTVKGIAYSKAHLHRLIKIGKFPRPIKIGENRNAWIEEEIDAHIEAKIADRDAAALKAELTRNAVGVV